MTIKFKATIMKKYILLFAAIVFSLGVMAQKGKVASSLTLIDQRAFDKAKEAIDQAMVLDKTKNWSNTYFAKGQLFQAV